MNEELQGRLVASLDKVVEWAEGTEGFVLEQAGVGEYPMNEERFNEAREWLFESVPEVARRWAPLYKELGWEINLHPKPNGVPSEADLIYFLNHMLQTHVHYSGTAVDVRCAGLRIVVEENADEGVRGAISFVDEEYENLPREEEDDDGE